MNTDQLNEERCTLEFCSAQTTQDILNGKGTKDDIGKPDYLGILTELELSFLIDCAKVLKHGRIKYTKDNWKKDLEPERIQKALLRHLVAYVNGEKLDKESGISHLCHIYANCQFLHYYDNKGVKNVS